MATTYKQSAIATREELKKLLSENNPKLLVAIKTRNPQKKIVEVGIGAVGGWKNSFATVYIEDRQWEFAWHTVANAVNNNSYLLV